MKKTSAELARRGARCLALKDALVLVVSREVREGAPKLMLGAGSAAGWRPRREARSARCGLGLWGVRLFFDLDQHVREDGRDATSGDAGGEDITDDLWALL